MNSIRRCADELADYLDPVEAVGAWTLERFAAAVAAEHDTDRRKALYRARFRTHVREFARFVMPEIVDMPWDAYAAWRLDRPKHHWRSGRPTERTADAAPRGIAKSTTERIDALHDVCYGLERYIVIAMASHSDAIEWSEALMMALREPSDALVWLYGPIKVVGGVEKWRATVNGHKTAVRCVSFGGKIRGTHDGNIRPTKIVCDDAEDRRRVRNSTLRRQDREFLTDDILKAGLRQGGTRFRWVGTVLARDAMLAMMLRGEAPLSGWAARRWKAVISWPERADLWDEYQRIYCDLQRGGPDEREAAAREFYEANRADMDRGVEVLNRHMMPIDRVYRIICDEGLRSVRREMQNEDTADPSEQVFDSTKMRRCKIEGVGQHAVIIAADGRRVPLGACRKFLRWDPAGGSSPDGDFGAVVVVARDAFGYTFCIHAWMRRASVTDQLAAVWVAAESFGVETGSLESNGMQSVIDIEFKRQMGERRAAGRFWQLALSLDPSTTNKEERICAQEPGVTNGWHQFADTLPSEFMSQFDDMRPDGSVGHDDGPDAWEGATVRAVAPARRVTFISREGAF